MSRIDEQPFIDRRILTRRQLSLAKPGLWLGLAASLCLCLAGWMAWPILRPVALEAASLENADGNSPQAARLLKVATSRLSDAGPTYLSQDFTGIVVPRRSSRLAAKVIGRVESLQVDLGDRVSEGQVLIQLDHAELDGLRGVAEASLASAKSRLQELERGPRAQEIEQAKAKVAELEASLQLKQANFERTSRLRQSSTTGQEVDEARFAVDVARAQKAAAEQAWEMLMEGTRQEQLDIQRATVAGLESELERIDADLADRIIVAPFAGNIKARYLDEGSIVSPGQALLEIVESPPYDIRVGLPSELDVQSLAGDVQITADGQILQATLERFSPTIDENTRTREVVLRLADSSSQLVTPGTAVSIAVRTQVQGQGYWLPTRSLTSGRGDCGPSSLPCHRRSTRPAPAVASTCWRGDRWNCSGPTVTGPRFRDQSPLMICWWWLGFIGSLLANACNACRLPMAAWKPLTNPCIRP